MQKLDEARLNKRAGAMLSPREIQAAARDFEEEMGHDGLLAMVPERLELAFSAYLHKWVKRFQRRAS